MKTKLTLEEVKRKTMELLLTDNPDDVSYITQEMVDRDNDVDCEEDTIDNGVEGKNAKGDILPSTIWGHNMRYGTDSEGYSIYLYERGSNPANRGNACGENSKKLRWSLWNHTSSRYSCSHGGTNHSLKTMFERV